MQLRLSEIRSVGAHLVAVSPQLPDQSKGTAQKDEVEFDVLSDVGNNVARQFGLVFTMPEQYREMGKKIGLDLAEVNGDESYELPLTATYVIGRDGTIACAFIDTDYSKRMEPDDIVAELKRLAHKHKLRGRP